MVTVSSAVLVAKNITWFGYCLIPLKIASTLEKIVEFIFETFIVEGRLMTLEAIVILSPAVIWSCFKSKSSFETALEITLLTILILSPAVKVSCFVVVKSPIEEKNEFILLSILVIEE